MFPYLFNIGNFVFYIENKKRLKKYVDLYLKAKLETNVTKKKFKHNKKWKK